MKSRSPNLTARVVNIIPIVALMAFFSYVLWQILMPNVSEIASTISVRIDGANTGSGVIVEAAGVGTAAPFKHRYLVLSNWHVVSPPAVGAKRSLTIGTSDGRKHIVSIAKVVRVGKLDLATLEFQSQYRYRAASIGNSARLREGDVVYVSGWADPSPQLVTRTYQYLVGNLSGRIDRPRDGYALVYTVNALPGMSGGPVLDWRGNLVGINGRATVDLRTGTVNSVLGIDIDRYLRARGDLPTHRWHKY
ncbi:serine protease [Chamaesiphon sp. VAR_69_metabat_338]|uniref:S1 family peptidase n=1 Tax=Chamaesiphon sp. VAR_69_metabat_338 TaxID=2964704 RepID=UPI00286E0415|nr:serine protease [Chamaesiphon sp. VAR_69_metabat_338]